MNSLDISKFLLNDKFTKPYFSGVFAADRLPTRISSSGMCVVNTDPMNKPGKHWIAITYDGYAYGDYFDSYGMSPYVIHHQTFLKRNITNLHINNIQLQSYNSIVCGEYCCVFLALRARGVSFECTLNILNKQNNTYLNDKNIKKLFTVLQNCTRLKCTHFNVHTLQNCCAKVGDLSI